MMLLARLQVESTRLLNRICAVLTEKRTGFNQAEADRYLADLMRPDIQPSTAGWILNRDGTYSLLIDGREVTCGNLDEFGMWYPKSSAASNPPGASDAGPVQDNPPLPVPGHPDPSPELCLCGHWVHVGNPCSACGCLVRMVQATPDTTDLIDDPEVELALVRCERDAALRRLGRYRDTFGPLPE